jgi:hypothetical protein
MAGERSVAGALAGAGSGAGVPGLLGLLLAMEAGVPIPVPSDLVLLLLGERVSAGALPRGWPRSPSSWSRWPGRERCSWPPEVRAGRCCGGSGRGSA